MEDSPSPISTHPVLCAAAGGNALPIANSGVEGLQTDAIVPGDSASQAGSTMSVAELLLLRAEV